LSVATAVTRSDADLTAETKCRATQTLQIR
jgi:hypothetical protein